MHTTFRAALATCLIALGALPSARAAPAACETRAITMLDALDRHDYPAAMHDWDAHMRATFQPDKVRSMWEALTGNSYNPYRSHASQGTTTDNGDGTVTVEVPLEFAYASMRASVTCNAKEGDAIAEFVVH